MLAASRNAVNLECHCAKRVFADVAYALVRAASRLISTHGFAHEICDARGKGVETSLDAARTSAYATPPIQVY